MQQELWDAVQAAKAGNRVERVVATYVEQPSLLAGKLIDGEGRKMLPSHTARRNKRYRYYVTHSADLINAIEPAWRIPAHDLEAAVVKRVSQMLLNRRMIASILGAAADADRLKVALVRAQSVAHQLEDRQQLRLAMTSLVTQVSFARIGS